MMKASIARELASALRHGGYRQVRGVLRNDRGFCVMGVAADIFGPLFDQHWVPAKGAEVFSGLNAMAIGDADHSRWPTPEICQYMIEPRAVDAMYDPFGNLYAGNAGMIYAPPQYCKLGGDKIAMSYLNDEGVRFRDIADLLDAHAAKMDELYPTVPDTLPAEYTRELVH